MGLAGAAGLSRVPPARPAVVRRHGCGPGSLENRARRSTPSLVMPYLVKLNFATWSWPSLSLRVKVPDLPAHALSVFQT